MLQVGHAMYSLCRLVCTQSYNCAPGAVHRSIGTLAYFTPLLLKHLQGGLKHAVQHSIIKLSS